MTTFWTPALLAECRNRRCVPFAALTKAARSMLIDAHGAGHVQVSYGVRWVAAPPATPMRNDEAYRLTPSFHPMSTK